MNVRVHLVTLCSNYFRGGYISAFWPESVEHIIIRILLESGRGEGEGEGEGVGRGKSLLSSFILFTTLRRHKNKQKFYVWRFGLALKPNRDYLSNLDG